MQKVYGFALLNVQELVTASIVLVFLLLFNRRSGFSGKSGCLLCRGQTGKQTRKDKLFLQKEQTNSKKML